MNQNSNTRLKLLSSAMHNELDTEEKFWRKKEIRFLFSNRFLENWKYGFIQPGMKDFTNWVLVQCPMTRTGKLKLSFFTIKACVLYSLWFISVCFMFDEKLIPYAKESMKMLQMTSFKSGFHPWNGRKSSTIVRAETMADWEILS